MTVRELKEYLEALPDDLEVCVEGGGGPEETWPADAQSVRIRVLTSLGSNYDPKGYSQGPPIPTCVIYG